MEDNRYWDEGVQLAVSFNSTCRPSFAGSNHQSFKAARAKPQPKFAIRICFQTAKTQSPQRKAFSLLQSMSGDCRNELCRVAASRSHLKLKTHLRVRDPPPEDCKSASAGYERTSPGTQFMTRKNVSSLKGSILKGCIPTLESH